MDEFDRRGGGSPESPSESGDDNRITGAPGFVRLVPHRPEWTIDFEAAARALARVLREQAIIAHHIGSTAIPGILARPIIDILLEVRSIVEIDGCIEHLRDLGYKAVGEHGISGRRFLIKDTGEERSHNLYIFEEGHGAVRYCLGFRDYLLAHPREAQDYSRLKSELVRQHPADLLSYMRGKESWICATLQRAGVLE